MKISIDMNTLTLGELEFFEEQSGLGIGDLAAGKSSTKALLALICIQERRTNPAFTMDDARKVPVSDIEIDVADPTPEKPKARAKASS
jgi:hypothetical protein